MRLHIFLLCLLLITGVCASVHAQAGGAPADGDAVARAKAYFKKGTQAYRLANFKEALGHFEEAMKLSPRPSVILNLGQCHRQLDNHKKALFFYKLYFTEWSRANPTTKGSPPFQEEVEGYIKELEYKVAMAKPEPAKPEPAKPEPAKPEPAKPEPGTQQADPLPTAQRADPRPTPAPQPRGSSVKKIAGWTLIATGAALTVSGIVLGALAADVSSQVEQGGGPGSKDWADFEEKETLGKNLNNAMIATLTIGAGAAVGGAVLILLHYTDRFETQSAWLAPSVTPGGAAVTAGVRF